MDMLVFNAQKLNNAVKETVRAAEAASIRVRLVPISFCFSFFLLLFIMFPRLSGVMPALS